MHSRPAELQSEIEAKRVLSSILAEIESNCELSSFPAKRPVTLPPLLELSSCEVMNWRRIRVWLLGCAEKTLNSSLHRIPPSLITIIIQTRRDDPQCRLLVKFRAANALGCPSPLPCATLRLRSCWMASADAGPWRIFVALSALLVRKKRCSL